MRARGALGGLGDHFAKQAAAGSPCRAGREILHTHADPIAGRDSRLDVGHLHARRARDEVLHHLEQVVAQHVALADLDRGQLHAFVVAGPRGGDLAARLLAAGLGLVGAHHRPGDQLLAVEDRHDRELVRVVDPAVDRLVAVEDVPRPHADRRVVAPILEDELDRDLPGDAVQVGAAHGRDQVARGGVEAGHRVPECSIEEIPIFVMISLPSWTMIVSISL